MPSRKVAEGGEQRHLIGSAKAGQSQALVAPTLQLEDRMQMPGDDVMAHLNGGRVPKRKRAEDQRLVDDFNPQRGRRIARPPVMVAANQRTGEPGVALSPFVQRGQSSGRVGFRRVQEIAEEDEVRGGITPEQRIQAYRFVAVVPCGTGWPSARYAAALPKCGSAISSVFRCGQ